MFDKSRASGLNESMDSRGFDEVAGRPSMNIDDQLMMADPRKADKKLEDGQMAVLQMRYGQK